MIILNIRFQIDYNELKHNNINTKIREALDNNLTFQLYYRSIYSNSNIIKTIECEFSVVRVLNNIRSPFK